ncbi:MAG: toll/interleukin-1 receptor domain-containing protein [Anaerolineales bacterium]
MSSEDSKVPQFDVFISYSTEDKAVADAVVSAHEKAGIRCWYAPRDIPPGADWGDAIIQAIERCSLMVLVFSGNADQSQRVLDELNYAISEGKPILPFRVEDLEPTGAMRLHLSSRHWLDAYHPGWETHIDRLIESVSINLGSSHETVQISEEKFAVGEGKEERFRIPSPPKVVYGVAAILILAGLVYFGWKSFGKGQSSAGPQTSPMPTGVETTPSQDTVSFEDSNATAVAGTQDAIHALETEHAQSTKQAKEEGATDTPVPSDTPTLTPTLIPNPTPILGSVLLEDSFVNNEHGWSTGEVDSEYWQGSRKIADGKYTWTVDRSFGAISWEYPSMDTVRDFYVSVDAQRVGGYFDTCYGIYFRGSQDNCYLFFVCGDEYGVLSFDHGDWQNLILWNESEKIRSGKNTLAVAGRESRFDFFINGALIDTIKDVRFESGYVGVAIRMKPGTKATFEFDDFTIWLLE